VRNLARKNPVKTRAILVMGVSGSGKTTIGRALANRMRWTFADADDYHPDSNRQKMSRGESLNDTDRQPWLEHLHGLLEEHVRNDQPLVLACSALKESYRQVLNRNLEGIAVVFLHGSRELIAERMLQREHFMPVSLLESQLLALEPPADAIVVRIGQAIDAMVEQVIARLEV
jgi:gluconokinase